MDTNEVTESEYDVVVAPESDPEWDVLRAEETDAEVNDIVKNVMAYKTEKDAKVAGMTKDASKNDKSSSATTRASGNNKGSMMMMMRRF